MTKTDPESLLKVCRLGAKVAKADVVALAAQRKAEFERQIAAIYHYDDAVWKQAHDAAKAAVEQAPAHRKHGTLKEAAHIMPDTVQKGLDKYRRRR